MDLRFNSVKMDETCCEIMATYNAMILAGYQVDFFKLALEFEYNATLYPYFISPFFPRGYFGSDPQKIKYCLQSYGIAFEVFNSCEEFEQNLPDGVCGIASYKFKNDEHEFWGCVCIHTFAVSYDDSHHNFKTINDISSNMNFRTYPSLSEALLKANSTGFKDNVYYLLKGGTYAQI